MSDADTLKGLLDESETMDYYLSNDLRVLIIGFGKMGLLHGSILNLLKPGIVRGIADKSRLLLFTLKKLLRGVSISIDIEKLIEEKLINVVYVTTPVSSHHVLALKSLELNVSNLFIEKPPTINLEQLERLRNRTGRNSIVMFGFQKRYSLPFRHAKKLLNMDAIGEIIEVEAHIKSGDITSATDRFKHIGRGVMLDLGVHLINLLIWLFRPGKVAEARYRSVYTGLDDEFTATIMDKEGFPIKVEASWIDPSYRLPETMIHMIGGKGELIVTEDYLRIKRADGSIEEYYKPYYYAGYPPVNLADPEYTIENIHFLNSVSTHSHVKTGIKDAYETMKLIDELYEKAGGV